MAADALYLVGLLGAVLSAAYGARVLAVVLGPAAPAAKLDTERPGTRRVGAPAVLAVAALATVTVVIGVVGLARADLRPGAGPLVLAGASSVVVVAAVVLLDRRRAGWTVPVLQDWWGLRGLLGGVGSAALRVAGVLAAADDRLVAATLAAPEATAPARFASAGVEVPLVRGVAALATGTRWLGVAARRPQTGLLHTYYAQAVLALVVLAATLVLVR